MRTTITLVLVLLSAAVYADNHIKTLERVAETGEFRIGYVPDAPLFRSKTTTAMR